MTKAKLATADSKQEVAEAPNVIDFIEFLETKHPSTQFKTKDMWRSKSGQYGQKYRALNFGPIRIHCWNQKCQGFRTFRCDTDPDVDHKYLFANRFVTYTCGDCRESKKQYSLLIEFDENDIGTGNAYKYGEVPAFGVPVPNNVLRLFGRDAKIFQKGRTCEAQGLGIGAFAYYRQMVESHKTKLFDDIIAACETLGAPAAIIDNLTKSKKEISFSKAMMEIKPATPEGLLISGHNPLLLLHSALSAGLHAGTDDECLQAAQDIRLVLTELIERLSQIKKDDAALNSAVQRLIARGGKSKA